MVERETLEAELRRMREEADRLRTENSRLRRENARLRVRISPTATDGQMAVQLQLLTPPSKDPVNPVISSSSAEEKIDLFMRLFQGRQDVYAVRWERPDGRAGYAPASRSRSDRERGVFLPLTFAALCGVSPIPASSGKTNRHRLNRGGDRQANAAPHRIVVVRLRYDQRIKE